MAIKLDGMDDLSEAQYLAHQLGKMLENNGIYPSESILLILQKHRELLTNRCLAKVKDDLHKAEAVVYKLESRIKQIRGLGGIPTSAIEAEVTDAKNKVNELQQKSYQGKKIIE